MGRDRDRDRDWSRYRMGAGGGAAAAGPVMHVVAAPVANADEATYSTIKEFTLAPNTVYQFDVMLRQAMAVSTIGPNLKWDGLAAIGATAQSFWWQDVDLQNDFGRFAADENPANVGLAGGQSGRIFGRCRIETGETGGVVALQQARASGVGSTSTTGADSTIIVRSGTAGDPLSADVPDSTSANNTPSGLTAVVPAGKTHLVEFLAPMDTTTGSSGFRLELTGVAGDCKTYLVGRSTIVTGNPIGYAQRDGVEVVGSSGSTGDECMYLAVLVVAGAAERTIGLSFGPETNGQTATVRAGAVRFQRDVTDHVSILGGDGVTDDDAVADVVFTMALEAATPYQLLIGGFATASGTTVGVQPSLTGLAALNAVCTGILFNHQTSIDSFTGVGSANDADMSQAATSSRGATEQMQWCEVHIVGADAGNVLWNITKENVAGTATQEAGTWRILEPLELAA